MVNTRIRDGKIRIHTSDRLQFRRCRRKAALASKLWHGLQPIRPNSILWLGSGVHYGVERYYGYQEDPVEAFNQWANEKIDNIRKTEGLLNAEMAKFDEALNMGRGVLEHYKKFSSEYDDFNVYVFPDGTPAVEILFEVPIRDDEGLQLHATFTEAKEGMNEEQLTDLEESGMCWVPVFYGGRIDLIVEDLYGDLWIWDHKTAKTFGDWSKLQLDTQVGSYIWAASQLFPALNKNLRGVIYNGLKKALPNEPEPLKNGKGLSVNKSQNTTYEVYLETLKKYGYGEEVDGVFVPEEKYDEILSILKNQTVVDHNSVTNKFFKRQRVERSKEEVESMGQHIYQEAVDMLSAQHFYPNPTRDCSWDCDFYDVCIGLNNKEDVQWQLDSLFEPRPEDSEETAAAWAQEE